MKVVPRIFRPVHKETSALDSLVKDIRNANNEVLFHSREDGNTSRGITAEWIETVIRDVSSVEELSVECSTIMGLLYNVKHGPFRTSGTEESDKAVERLRKAIESGIYAGLTNRREP